MKESIIIYGKEKCPHTRAAMDAYKEKGIETVYLDVLESAEAMEKMLTLSEGQRRVPVIVDGEKITIGWEGRT